MVDQSLDQKSQEKIAEIDQVAGDIAGVIIIHNLIDFMLFACLPGKYSRNIPAIMRKLKENTNHGR